MEDSFPGNIKQLFVLGKNWLHKLWSAKGYSVENIQVEKKTQNPGFVLLVSVVANDVLGNEETQKLKVKYFAKVEHFHLHHMRVHHILKQLNVSPSDMYFSSLGTDGMSGLTLYGIITEEISEFKMARRISSTEAASLCSDVKSELDLFSNDAFMLTFIGIVFNLPCNLDCWGLVKPSHGQWHRVKYVNHLFSEHSVHSYDVLDVEECAFSCRNRYHKSLIPVSVSVSATSLRVLLTAEGKAKLRRDFPWLSEKRVLEVIQRADDEVKRWFNVGDDASETTSGSVSGTASPTSVTEFASLTEVEVGANVKSSSVYDGGVDENVKNASLKRKRNVETESVTDNTASTVTPPLSEPFSYTAPLAVPIYTDEHIKQHRTWKGNMTSKEIRTILSCSDIELENVRARVKTFFSWFDSTECVDTNK